jgi:hypothetical protein
LRQDDGGYGYDRTVLAFCVMAMTGVVGQKKHCGGREAVPGVDTRGSSSRGHVGISPWVLGERAGMARVFLNRVALA